MGRHGGWEPSGFGHKLRTIRESKGLTQEELAHKVACHKMTVVKLEAGTQEPAWPLVIKLCDALDVSTEAFRLKKGETIPSPSETPRRPRGRPVKAPTGDTKKQPSNGRVSKTKTPKGTSSKRT